MQENNRAKGLAGTQLPEDAQRTAVCGYRHEMIYSVQTREDGLGGFLGKQNSFTVIMTAPFDHANGSLVACEEGDESSIEDEVRDALRILIDTCADMRVFLVSLFNPTAWNEWLFGDTNNFDTLICDTEFMDFFRVRHPDVDELCMQYGLFLIETKDGIHTIRRAWIPADPTKPPTQKIIDHLIKGTSPAQG